MHSLNPRAEGLSERQIEASVRRAVRRNGGLALKFVSPGWRGAPDRIVIAPGGRIVFVEFKAPGERPRPLQARRHWELRRLDCDVRVVDSLTSARALIDDLFGGVADDL